MHDETRFAKVQYVRREQRLRAYVPGSVELTKPIIAEFRDQNIHN